MTAIELGIFSPWSAKPLTLPSNLLNSDPQSLGGVDGHRSIPSSEVAGAKSDGLVTPSSVGAPSRGSHESGYSEHAVANSISSPISSPVTETPEPVSPLPLAGSGTSIQERGL